MLCPNHKNTPTEETVSHNTELISRKTAERDYDREVIIELKDTTEHVIIEDGTEKICNSLLCKNKKVKTVTLPDSVTYISWGAFDECTALTQINIPDSVTYIGDNAFIDCTALTSVTIPDSVTYIGDGAFNGCTALAEIKLSGSVTEIYDWTFNSCTSLEKITVPDSVKAIDSYAFFNCTALAEIVLSDSLSEIGTDAFGGCNIRRVSVSASAYDRLSEKYDLQKIFGNAEIIINNKL